jgi:SAM-dependent methyltransferase
VSSQDTHYWNTVAYEWTQMRHDRLWRAHSDAVNRALFDRWLPARRVPCLLKTDLFDETVGEGLDVLLLDRADKVIGIDVSVLTLQASQAHGTKRHTLGGDVRALPFAAESFDVIVSSSTLDHFQTRAEFLASFCELHRVLRVNGQLLLTLDNPINPAVWLRNLLPFRLLNRLGLVPYYVGITCGPRELRRILDQVGFEVVETSAIMHCPRALAVAVARRVSQRAGSAAQARLLRVLMSFEVLGRWPTRYVTGYFHAVRARKMSGPE